MQKYYKMKLLVCISNVPDTTTKIKFNNHNTQLDSTGIQWVINPWDELALTRAIELKEDEKSPVSEVHVINVGLNETEPTLRKCLAMGADSAFRINYSPKDAYSTAQQIANFIENKPYEFVICGIESGDYNGSVVGGMLSELAHLPSLSSVSDIQFENNNATIERDIVNGKEYTKLNGPAVLIAHKGFAKEARIPNMRGIMVARSKPLTIVEPIDAEILTEFVDFELPNPKSRVTLIDSENLNELIHLLNTEAKVL
jgi:electron transfer flavoprotein beta subunit